MAEVNTGSSSNKFVFGQNMEDRAVKEEAQQNNKAENGNAENQPAPLLRPSAFHSPNPAASGILAPSRLGNPLRSSGGFGSPSGGGGGTEAGMPNSSLSHNPFANKFSALSPDHEGGYSQEASSQPKFTLRPSALDKQTANFKRASDSNADNNPTYKSTFKLEPAKLQSPLTKKNEKSPGAEKSPTSPEDCPAQPPDGGAAAESEEIKQRLFGPEGATDVDDAEKGPAVKKSEGASGFVFGQNMDKRVTAGDSSKPEGIHVFGENLSDRVEKGEAEEDPAEGKDPEDKNKEEREEEKEEDTQGKEEDESNGTKTLAESAAIHQAKQSRPELQEVEVKTGEENESNVFQVNAKLFVFEKDTHNWLERGRGLLRLNDMCATDTQSFQSRLVMRIAGSLRVVMNTKIWPEMMVERASPKSIRVSAMDAEEGAKVYLIMANVKDADQIFTAIDSRVSQLRLHDSREGEKGKLEDPRVAHPADSGATNHQSEKRHSEAAAEDPAPASKKIRVDPEQRRDITTEESNDSSTVDPETEGDPASSNESFTSSPTVKSSSSEA